MGVQVLSYGLIKGDSSDAKIKKILSIVKHGDIVMLEGRLTPDEENTLISQALKSVSGRFSGVEIAFLNSKTSKSLLEKFRDGILHLLAKERIGITVIGPSKVIKEIKMDPQKLEILFK